MSVRFLGAIAMAVLFSFASAPISQAALVYDVFFKIAGSEAADIIIPAAPGQVFAGAEVYLRETKAEVDASVLASAPVLSFAVQVLADGEGSATNATQVGAGTALSSPNTLSELSFVGARSAVSNGNVAEFLLGTVDLVAPATVGGSSRFTFADPQASVNNFRLSNGGVISDDLFTSRSLTLSVAAVPEPSTVLALAAVGGVAAYRLRRRKLAKAAV
ncbi:hypothetical protein K227x_51840 [Rubripirellula lacrimiformis]|uniref:Ice-binding protein C-terminal domain-containing protein n=1 Tax=Rubripirellula lacrimiformis TaxID=1930273 RepID=A0A517NI57_9BACT|nr:PEP-CTERM sorting domain-containing protein [Rubripirellula lacrimiformis]QDT06768.1 hypothetical protein K227x_51840 [Rubripirellula lacrimiformis]